MFINFYVIIYITVVYLSVSIFCICLSDAQAPGWIGRVVGRVWLGLIRVGADIAARVV